MYFTAYVIPYFLLVAIALYWPAHSSPFNLDFTQSLWARMVPSISAYIDKSPFPHATAAYFVFSGLLTIPGFILSCLFPLTIQGWSSLKRRVAEYEKYRENRFRTWILLPCIVTLGIWIMWIQPGYQYGIIPISSQRWALAFFWIVV